MESDVRARSQGNPTLGHINLPGLCCFFFFPENSAPTGCWFPYFCSAFFSTFLFVLYCNVECLRRCVARSDFSACCFPTKYVFHEKRDLFNQHIILLTWGGGFLVLFLFLKRWMNWTTQTPPVCTMKRSRNILIPPFHNGYYEIIWNEIMKVMLLGS